MVSLSDAFVLVLMWAAWIAIYKSFASLLLIIQHHNEECRQIFVNSIRYHGGMYTTFD